MLGRTRPLSIGGVIFTAWGIFVVFLLVLAVLDEMDFGPTVISSSLTLGNWINLATLIIALLGVGGLYLELRGSREAANAQASLGFFQIWSSREFVDDLIHEGALEWDSYEHWRKEYLNDTVAQRAALNILNFFEMLGVACQSGGLDTALAYEFFGGAAIHYWKRYEQWIEGYKKMWGAKEYMKNFKWLSNECQRQLARK